MKNSPKYEIIKLGNHLLAHGDSTDADLIAKLVGKEKINLVLADPPYGCNYVASKKNFGQVAKDKTIINDDITDEKAYTDFSVRWLRALIPHLAPKNAMYIFNSDIMLFSLREAIKLTSCKFSQLLIWVKNQAVIGRLNYLPQHELIIYCWYKRHYFRKAQDKSVLFCPKPHQSKIHPTIKPLSLLRRLILNSTKPNDIVFDPFGGSGNSLLACQQTGRRCLMVELDREYFLTISRRFNELIK